MTIAIAFALTIQYDTCLEGHVQAASKHGMKAMRMLEDHQ